MKELMELICGQQNSLSEYLNPTTLLSFLIIPIALFFSIKELIKTSIKHIIKEFKKSLNIK